MKNKHQNDSVLIVSHGGPICCLLAHLHKDILEHTKNYSTGKNTAISIIEIDKEGRCNFELLNCIDHLESMEN